MKRVAANPRALVCVEPGCFELATVRVQVDDLAPVVCAPHWQDLRSQSGPSVSVLEVLDRPKCFKAACPSDAVSGMPHLDGRCLPVCEEHLEDLSWVVPDAVDLACLAGNDAIIDTQGMSPERGTAGRVAWQSPATNTCTEAGGSRE